MNAALKSCAQQVKLAMHPNVEADEKSLVPLTEFQSLLDSLLLWRNRGLKKNVETWLQVDSWNDPLRMVVERPDVVAMFFTSLHVGDPTGAKVRSEGS